MTQVGSVGELWRYPVKSMRGERLAAAQIEARGLVGDRGLAVYDADGKIGSGKITRRFRAIAGLRAHAARMIGGAVAITSPEGLTIRTSEPNAADALAASLEQTVSLRAETDVAHHDAAPVHLLTTTSLREISARVGRALDAFQFRPNIVVETDASWPAEEDWVGRTIAIGSSVRLRIAERTERCIMVNALPDDGKDERVIRAIARENESCLGVYAEVLTPGTITQGDLVTLV